MKLYQNLVYYNPEIICTVPPYGLTVHRFSPMRWQLYEEFAGNEVLPEQSLKSNVSIKIWCTVTSKQYALYHLIV